MHRQFIDGIDMVRTSHWPIYLPDEFEVAAIDQYSVTFAKPKLTKLKDIKSSTEILPLPSKYTNLAFGGRAALVLLNLFNSGYAMDVRLKTKFRITEIHSEYCSTLSLHYMDLCKFIRNNKNHIDLVAWYEIKQGINLDIARREITEALRKRGEKIPFVEFNPCESLAAYKTELLRSSRFDPTGGLIYNKILNSLW